MSGSAPAYAFSQDQAQTYAVPLSGHPADEIQAQLAYNDAVDQTEGYTTHWVGIQNNNTHVLVQAGENNHAYGLVNEHGFFYEFVGNSTLGIPGVGPVDITSYVSGQQPGDMLKFVLYYHDIDTWGLQIWDIRNGTVLGNIYTGPYLHNNSHASDFIAYTPIISTEHDPYYGLLNDGLTTVKQPQWHDQGSTHAWHYFGSAYSGAQSDNMVNGDETATIPNAEQYAYHTWVKCC